MATDTPSPSSPVHNVLFVCHHGAAKSVLAASHFNRMAAELGLEVRATARGTEPGEAVFESVRDDVGGALCTSQPSALTEADIAQADLVVAFDLAEPELGAQPDMSWNAVPALSTDFAAGRANILERVAALVADLKTRVARGSTNTNT